MDEADRIFQCKELASVRHSYWWGSSSLLQPLIFQLLECPSYERFVGGIARQLLALGYCRRELHPAPLTLLDENLNIMRLTFERYERYSTPTSHIESLLKSLEELLHAGPLSLKQLARIAIRRAVGGIDFARQVKRLKSRITPPLLEYVADPTELMLSDDKVYHRMKSDTDTSATDTDSASSTDTENVSS